MAGHEHEFLLDIVGGQTFVLPALAGTFSQGVQTVVSGGVAVEGLDWAIKTKLGESVCR